MASIPAIGVAPTQLFPLTVAHALQGTGGTAAGTNASPAGDTSADTTTYVTNADGTIDVTTSNAQGQITALSTLSAPVVAAATTGGGAGLPRGALLTQLA